MHAIEKQAEFFHTLKSYTELWAAYIARGICKTRDPQDKENPVSNELQSAHYFSVGYDAMRIVINALVSNRRPLPQKILDFPCGSGRVTRHLRAMFPSAKIGACDLYESHIRFCAEHFNAEPIMSFENLDDLDTAEKWDLIFCGSLLSHLPQIHFWPTIKFITRSLSSNGIAIVTLEGRHAEYIQDNKWKFIDDDSFNIARKSFHDTGFGFVDYNTNFKTLNFPDQERYGITLVKPSWIMKGIEAMEDIRILGFAERDWDDHQDVIVFGRPAINL